MEEKARERQTNERALATEEKKKKDLQAKIAVRETELDQLQRKLAESLETARSICERVTVKNSAAVLNGILLKLKKQKLQREREYVAFFLNLLILFFCLTFFRFSLLGMVLTSQTGR